MDVTAFITQREPKHYFYLKLVYNLSISLLRKVALLFRSLKNVVMATVLRIITGAQPKAGTGLKMQTVRFFNVTLLGIYRWLRYIAGSLKSYPPFWKERGMVDSQEKDYSFLRNDTFPNLYDALVYERKFMYRSNRSFNMPPPGNPPGIWLFWKLLFKFPPTRAKMPFKCPHPGDVSQAQNCQRDGGNAFSCRTKSL